jgi:hypothetical protein
VAVSGLPNYADLLGSEPDPNGTLVVLFIPTQDKNGKPLRDAEVWAGYAAQKLTDLFGGATEMPAAKGRWLNEETGETIVEDVKLIHCYVRSSHANDAGKFRDLADFLHRMGEETNQGEVVVVVAGVMHRITKFRRRRGRGKK